MAIVLEIPDAVALTMGLSQEEARQELVQDIALALYARGALSAGGAADLAHLTALEFERLLSERQVVRNYSAEDLEHDLAWVNSKPDSSDRGEIIGFD